MAWGLCWDNINTFYTVLKMLYDAIVRLAKFKRLGFSFIFLKDLKTSMEWIMPAQAEEAKMP